MRLASLVVLLALLLALLYQPEKALGQQQLDDEGGGGDPYAGPPYDEDEAEDGGAGLEEEPEDDLLNEPDSTPLLTLDDLDLFLSKDNHFGGGVLGVFSPDADKEELAQFQQLAPRLVSNGIPFAHSTAPALLDKFGVTSAGSSKWKVFVFPVPRFVDTTSGESVDREKYRFGGSQSLASPDQQHSLLSFALNKYLPLVSRLAETNEFVFSTRDEPVLVLVMENGVKAAALDQALAELRAIALPLRAKFQFAWAEADDLDATANFALDEMDLGDKNSKDNVAAILKGHKNDVFVLRSSGSTGSTEGVARFLQQFLANELVPLPRLHPRFNGNDDDEDNGQGGVDFDGDADDKNMNFEL